MNNIKDLPPLLARAVINLESNDWGGADDCCERYLDTDPCNAYAYVIKIMARVHVSNEEELVNATATFRDWYSYKNAIKFADDDLKARLEGYVSAVEDRIRLREEERERAVRETNSERMYKLALGCEKVGTPRELKKAADMYEQLSGYRDSAERASMCVEKASRLEAQDRAVRIREEEIYRKEKKEKSKATFAVIGALFLAVVIIAVAASYASSARVAEIEEKIAGMKFHANFFEAIDKTSGGAMSSVTKMIQKDVTYEFNEDGTITVTTVKYYDETFIIVNGERQWDDVQKHTETLDGYEVKAPVFGKISILIDGEWCPLNVNSNDYPESFTIGNITYEEG